MTTHYAVGMYQARITGQRFDKTKNDNPVIVLDIMPQVDGGDGQYGRSISWVITEKTIDFVVEKLRRVGFVGQSFAELDPAGARFHDLSGQVIEVYCSHDDRGYENWDLPRPQAQRAQIPSGERQTMTARLDALFGKKLKGASQKKTKAPDKPAPTDAELKREAVAASDEIPF